VWLVRADRPGRPFMGFEALSCSEKMMRWRPGGVVQINAQIMQNTSLTEGRLLNKRHQSHLLVD
jgi:hypothetical protein